MSNYTDPHGRKLVLPQVTYRCPYCKRRLQLRSEGARANARVPVRFICPKHGTVNGYLQTYEG